MNLAEVGQGGLSSLGPSSEVQQHMKKTLSIFVLFAVLGVVLAGCGGGDKPAEGDKAAKPAATTGDGTAEKK